MTIKNRVKTLIGSDVTLTRHGVLDSEDGELSVLEGTASCCTRIFDRHDARALISHEFIAYDLLSTNPIVVQDGSILQLTSHMVRMINGEITVGLCAVKGYLTATPEIMLIKQEHSKYLLPAEVPAFHLFSVMTDGDTVERLPKAVSDEHDTLLSFINMEYFDDTDPVPEAISLEPRNIVDFTIKMITMSPNNWSTGIADVRIEHDGHLFEFSTNLEQWYKELIG